MAMFSSDDNIFFITIVFSVKMYIPKGSKWCKITKIIKIAKMTTFITNANIVANIALEFIKYF